jgi:hypothetical protein
LNIRLSSNSNSNSNNSNSNSNSLYLSEKQKSNPEKYKDDIESLCNSIFLKLKDNKNIKNIENKSLSDIDIINKEIEKEIKKGISNSMPSYSMKIKQKINKIFLNKSFGSIGCLKDIQKKKNFSN